MADIELKTGSFRHAKSESPVILDARLETAKKNKPPFFETLSARPLQLLIKFVYVNLRS